MFKTMEADRAWRSWGRGGSYDITTKCFSITTPFTYHYCGISTSHEKGKDKTFKGHSFYTIYYFSTLKDVLQCWMISLTSFSGQGKSPPKEPWGDVGDDIAVVLEAQGGPDQGSERASKLFIACPGSSERNHPHIRPRKSFCQQRTACTPPPPTLASFSVRWVCRPSAINSSHLL